MFQKVAKYISKKAVSTTGVERLSPPSASFIDTDLDKKHGVLVIKVYVVRPDLTHKTISIPVRNAHKIRSTDRRFKSGVLQHSVC